MSRKNKRFHIINLNGTQKSKEIIALNTVASNYSSDDDDDDDDIDHPFDLIQNAPNAYEYLMSLKPAVASSCRQAVYTKDSKRTIRRKKANLNAGGKQWSHSRG